MLPGEQRHAVAEIDPEGLNRRPAKHEEDNRARSAEVLVGGTFDWPPMTAVQPSPISVVYLHGVSGGASVPNTRGFVRAISTTSSHPFTTVMTMGRPRIYDEPRIATAIRLPASLRDELLAAATERDVSVNFLVTRAVSDYLRRLSPPGGDALRGAHRGHRRSSERTKL